MWVNDGGGGGGGAKVKPDHCRYLAMIELHKTDNSIRMSLYELIRVLLREDTTVFTIFQILYCPNPPGGGRLLVNCVPMREQRTAKLTLNSVFHILKLIPLFHCAQSKSNPFQCSKLK